MEKTKGNKLIAEFMGGQNKMPKTIKWILFDDVKFHESWDWLMPVVEKIDSILSDDDFVTISYNRCMIEVNNPNWIFPENKVGIESLTFEGVGNSRIEATWSAVCEFITWYNE